MVTSMTFAGDEVGLGQIDDDAVLASGTAAPSFPCPEEQDDDALGTASGGVVIVSDGFLGHGGRTEQTAREHRLFLAAG